MNTDKSIYLTIFSYLLISFTVFTQVNSTNLILNKFVENDTKRLVEVFRDIHSNRELGSMELRTAAIVTKELKALGFEAKAGIGKAGVVGILKNGIGPIVMYCADMNCNSVQETTAIAYANNKLVKNRLGEDVPAMEACGHDAHRTWMLGIAKAIVALKKDCSRTLMMVGQHAEELGEGVEAMINDKMSEKGVPVPDYLFEMHTAPFLVGIISNRSGRRMTGMDVLGVEFQGICPRQNIKNIPAVMGSEDFRHLVIHNPKPVYAYVLVCIANKEASEKATKEGEMFPFFNHNSNFGVDLSAIPLGVTLGTTALLEIFKK